MAATEPTPIPRQVQTPKRRAPFKGAGWFGVLLLIALVAADAVVGERGLLATLRARREYQELSSALERQRAENARLREEARRLREDPAAIEELARKELGLIRPGERVFIIRDLKTPPAPGAGPQD